MRKSLVFLFSFSVVIVGVGVLRGVLANGQLSDLAKRNLGTRMLSSQSQAPTNLRAAKLSDDGQRIVYLDQESKLSLWERGVGSLTLDPKAIVKDASISSNARYVFYLVEKEHGLQARVWQEGLGAQDIGKVLEGQAWKIESSASGERALVYSSSDEPAYLVKRDSKPRLSTPNEKESNGRVFEVEELAEAGIIAGALSDRSLALLSSEWKLKNKSGAVKRAVKFDIDSDGGADLITFRPGSKPPLWRARTLSGYRGVVPQVSGVPHEVFTWRVGHPGGVPIVGDFDGDGVNDLATFLPGFGADWEQKKDNWHLFYSSSSEQGQGRFAPLLESRHGITWGWGYEDSIATPGDFDGDGAMDLGVFIPSASRWHILLSGGGFHANKAVQGNYKYGKIFGRGQRGDIPVVGDYNGDGVDELALARYVGGRLQWDLFYYPVNGKKVKKSRTIVFGKIGDIPLPADVNGDGKTDIVVYRPSERRWFVRASQNDTKKVDFGIEGAQPVTGDFDADGRDDLAFYTPGVNANWIIRSSRFVHAKGTFGERAPSIHRIAWFRKGEQPIQLALREHQWLSHRARNVD